MSGLAKESGVRQSEESYRLCFADGRTDRPNKSELHCRMIQCNIVPATGLAESQPLGLIRPGF